MYTSRTNALTPHAIEHCFLHLYNYLVTCKCTFNVHFSEKARHVWSGGFNLLSVPRVKTNIVIIVFPVSVKSAEKKCLYAQANVLARKFCLCNISTKITLFQAYCAPMYTSSLWCKFKKYNLKSITVAYNNSLRILINLPSRCSASLCLPPTTLNLLMKSFVHPYLVFYVEFISRINLLFINYLHSDIHYKSCMYTYWRSLLYT